MDDLISKQAVLTVLEKLLEEADELVACGVNPTAEEAIVRAIDRVFMMPISDHFS